ncbi:hypothetical protein I0C86_24985 [Plantactinospora sp. S1510]|uniref:Uncharacterized protein n=1 Tax=Plantactinospora alkalitolerans TaxID=2789879 RepID=A0ABS0H1G8_9ACTN|nr:hypothetical protein [Plantactinospora alkalitolerans]MBF9132179.1 hypothetical protein [Plantactinospora alkalitolerans]
MFGNETVEVDFGAGPVTVPAWTTWVNLTGGRSGIPVPTDGPVDWTQLDKLPYCHSLLWSGAERGVVAALSKHGITGLEWRDASGEIDLTSTALDGLRLTARGLRRLRLPASLTSMFLQDPPPTVDVDAPESGRRIELLLFFGDQEPAIPAGLRSAGKVWLKVGRKFSARTLHGLAALESLDIELLDPPGTLTDTEELGVHQKLHTLLIENAYDWDPATLPELPALRELELNGTRRTTAAAVRARFKGTGVEVSVSGARSERWLAANIDNPFMDWVDDSKPFAIAACKAYTKALKAVDAIPADAPDRLPLAETVLRGFVADLDAVQEKYHLIDTLNREHAGEVFAGLAARAGVPEETAEGWFDDRNF